MSRESSPKQGTRRARSGPFWSLEHLTSAPFMLAVSTLCLCLIGLVMVYSASSIELAESGVDAAKELTSQSIFLLIGFVACYIVYRFGANIWLDMFVIGLWVFVMITLVLVLIIGVKVNGARRWIALGGITFQPSEFAKIVIVMLAARVFARYESRTFSWKRVLVYLVIFVGLPLGLILAQKDLGTLIIVGVSLYLMAYLAGVKPQILIGVFVVGIAAILIAIFAAGYRSSRLTTWLDPYADYYGTGWQSVHGLYAFATGGFFGLGLGNSRQKYSYLPEAENDFIFAIIGEELGFLGAMVVIILFCIVGISGLRIAAAARVRNREAWLMCACFAILLDFQAFINMAGVLGVLPLTGRPLPFISSGGSSIVSCLIMIGLILGVSRDTERWYRNQEHRERLANLELIEGGRTERSTGRL